MDRNAHRARILIIEDEPAIRAGVCDLLAFHGFAPHGVGHGTQGLHEAQSGQYELVVVDVMLPGMDGFSICRELRASRPRQAIMLLTAKDSEQDILTGFAAGCDDYIAKPFSLQLFLARVRALLRRREEAPVPVARLGSLELDAEALEVRGPAGKLALSPRDAQILALFAAQPGKIISRVALLREVWGYQRAEDVETRAVDMHMVKLRRSLASVGADESMIETVRGAGYRLKIEDT